jgi:hypothetical protein
MEGNRLPGDDDEVENTPRVGKKPQRTRISPPPCSQSLRVSKNLATASRADLEGHGGRMNAGLRMADESLFHPPPSSSPRPTDECWTPDGG